jgi:hypothetical protein
MQLELDPLTLSVSDLTKSTTVEMDATMSLRWHDTRLLDEIRNPCLGVMSSLLSLSTDEADSDISRVQKAA